MKKNLRKKSDICPPQKRRVHFAFFGTSHIAAYVLDELERAGLTPALVIAPHDKPQGRGLSPTPVAIAKWAQEHGVPLAHDTATFEKNPDGRWDVAVVVDYGQILSKKLIEIPACGFLNVHPSLLPRLRGPSPIRSAILNDEKITGVSIIQLDEEMDHGPIVAQKKVDFSPPAHGWPVRNSELERILLTAGGILLAQILPQWIEREIDAHPQNHDVATYCGKIKKEDGLLDLSSDPYKNLLKIRAFEGWPGTYTFFERPSTRSGQEAKKLRVGILDAHIVNNKLVIDRVKPAGKREMDYEEFLRSDAKPL